MEKINIQLNGDQEFLEIREGEALPLHEEQHLALNGTLQAPGDFLRVRKEQFPVNACHVLVNQDLGTITLVSRDQSEIGGAKITGALRVHPDYERLGVNNQKVVRTTQDLATWIKMNRSVFESREIAMSLVTVLRNFRANISKEVEKSSDDRANYATKVQQAVESNIPDAFKVSMPLFVGMKPFTFNVEVIINPDDFSCALISPDAADMIKFERKTLMDEQIKRFDGYAIIYQ